ncbi:hypothetical protein QQF64_033820 [Cirrhinus molitorella]|uniref:Uncharacterized protein n=1 Tax=Cirrhinus molitorella TaxID=172907 RepID=A0ABR3MV06_9TELE
MVVTYVYVVCVKFVCGSLLCVFQIPLVHPSVTLRLEDADDGEAAQSADDSSPTASEKALSEAAEVEGEPEAKAALPPFYPFSPRSSGSESDVRLKARLARMQMEAQERAQMRQAEMELRLKVRTLEIEAEKQVKLRQIELEAMKVTSGAVAQPSPVVPPVNVASDSSAAAFDISKHIALVPHFRETEVDTYFTAFERIASALHWPKEVWPLLLHCRLIGKAQEVCSALPLEESLQYDSVKNAILRAYELIPLVHPSVTLRLEGDAPVYAVQSTHVTWFKAPQSDVFRELGVSQSLISRLASKHRTTGRVHDRPRSGAPRVTDRNDDQ